jgi:SAM-dependent methyltransferase
VIELEMGQRISNIYRLVTLPRVYQAIGDVLGADAARVRFVEEDLHIPVGAKVLDVGCGPGAMVPFLPSVDYTGIDLNPLHIETARRRFGDKGRFMVVDAGQSLPGEDGTYDVAYALALLHHLDDAAAVRLLTALVRLVKIGGRIVTLDNVYLPGQHPIARLLNKLDSGLNVRDPAGYEGLTAGLPVSIETRVYRDRLRVPYDHFRMALMKRATQ